MLPPSAGERACRRSEKQIAWGCMSKRAVELLEAFEALAPEDRQALAVEILRRTREMPFDSGPLSDEDVGEAGRALFAHLDQEEDAARKG